MYDVIAVGSNTVDVFAKTDSELVEIRTKTTTEALLAYPLGSKILITELEFMIGGGGTNTAVSFARQGFKTGYLGKIGRDENGLKVFKLLKDEKIDFLGTLGIVGGYSIILDSIKEDRTILTYKGCNNNLSFKELNLKNLKAEWFYFASMMGKSFETLKKLSEHAKKNNIKVAFNASSYLAQKGFSYIKKILENTNIFILNKQEAELIVGKGNIPDLVKRLKLPNMDFIIITDGPKGAFCYDGRFLYEVNPNKNRKVKETTGAGDAFASTFVAGIMKNKKVEDCLRMASINAESVIENYGAKNILLSDKELSKKLKKDKRVVKKRKL
ncbi:MAG: carbohydrate kinase family protein [Nanoarchaeota archaeon]|nr:carbohydrate kinase family protein [Nanoarchaeota archaeon]MBU1269569.1 carbohydrate kinase family protein [Nanoarchaeota archaeon]MBU1604699.1 carbohydrate kinase family protein [Nanoarchaeota archaeon]MBU2443830.1 carbohydrate kinase family protein [Nanoarchaeota archaeon]